MLLLNLPPVACSKTNSKSTAMPRVYPTTSSLDVTQWKNSSSIFSTVKTYLRSTLSKKLKLIASLVPSDHVRTFTKYTFKLNSLLLKRQKKNSLRNNTSAKHSIKQQTFTNAYLLICHHKKRKKLYHLLDKHWFLFKGTLGLLPTKLVLVEIKSNARPFHGCAFSVPKAYESMIYNEVNCLCHLNVLCQCNESEWAAPSFRTPKKNGQIRFISDFAN